MTCNHASLGSHPASLLTLAIVLLGGLSFTGLLLTNVRWSVGLLFGTIAISRAPATIVALVRESRSKGVFTKTLVAAVALNILAPLKQLFEASVLGCSTALGLQYLARWSRRPELLVTGGLVAILLTWGVASAWEISPLLACVIIGLAQTNLISDRTQVVDRVFSDFEPAILAVFFTLAGMELTFSHIERVGMIAAAFFVLRFSGKLAAGWLAMRLAGATDKLRCYLGVALIPQAGVAIGLLLLLEQDAVLQQNAHGTLQVFGAVILSAKDLRMVFLWRSRPSSSSRNAMAGHGHVLSASIASARARKCVKSVDERESRTQLRQAAEAANHRATPSTIANLPS